MLDFKFTNSFYTIFKGDIDRAGPSTQQKNYRMQIRNIQLKNQRLLIVGPIYNRTDKLAALEKFYNPGDILVFIGDIAYPYKYFSDVTKRIHELQGFAEGKKFFYILGDKDLLFMKQTYTSHADTYDWFNQQTIAIRFTFENNSSVLVLHGGIMMKHKILEELNGDLELSFVNNLPDSKKNWHKNYDGRFGYVVSSHPANKKNKPEMYNYSSSLDTNCHESNILVVQELNDKGVVETFEI